MPIEISDHFSLRYEQRIAKTKRMAVYANRAFHYGKTVDEIHYKPLAKELSSKEKKHGSIAKVYANCVYWFNGTTAVTVYPLPQKMHGVI